jgi:hypothetical protein
MPPQFPNFSSSQTFYLSQGNVVISAPGSGAVNGGITTCLPINTNSTITSEGLTILASDSGPTSLTITSNGNLTTSANLVTTGQGYITSATSLNSNSINVGGSNFTVSSAGSVTTASTLNVGGVASIIGNLNVGTNLITMNSTSGAIYTPGTFTAASNITVMDTTNTNTKITLGNDGHISAAGAITSNGDLTVGASKLVLSSGSGNLTLNGIVASGGDVNVNAGNVVLSALNGNILGKGSLTVGSAGQLVVSATGALSTSGLITSVGLVTTADVNVNGGNVVLSASNGNVTAKGLLTVGSTGQLTVSASGILTTTGDLFVNGASNAQIHMFSSDASVSSTYTGYVAPASSTDTLYTSSSSALSANPLFFTTLTSTKLTTQYYVDTQIYNQTARLNLILGQNIQNNLETFQNVFQICQQIEGSSAAQSVSSLTTQASQIKVSVSNVMTQAENPYVINAVPAVWGINCPPMPIPYTLTGLPTPNYTGDGWFFSNTTSGNQITWSIPVNSGMTLGKLQQFYMNVFAASNLSLPQIVIKSSNSTYNNIITYKFSASGSSSSANKNYCLYTTASPFCCDANVATNGTGSPINTYGFVPNPSEITASLSLTYSSVSTNPSLSGTAVSGFTTYASSADPVSSITIQTDSSVTSASTIQFILQSLYIVQTSSTQVPAADPIGTTQFLFQNTSVVQNYMMNYFFKKHLDFSANPTPSGAEGNYETAYINTFVPSS